MKYNNTKKIARYYDERAENAEDAISAAGQWVPKKYTPQMCEEICRKIKLTNNDKVLEVGSGSDVLGKYVRQKCSFYVGIDISSLMLKKSLDKANKEIKPNLIQSATDKIPCRENFFNITIMNSVAMYLRDEGLLEKTLVEMERVTSRGGIIFIGENIIPSRTYWEYTWFQNLNPGLQVIAKPYIRFRLWLAKKNSALAKKWKDYYFELSPNFLKKFFKGRAVVQMSDAAAFTIRKKFLGKNSKGNRRVDFLIKFSRSEN